MVAEQRETVQRIDADTHDIMSNVSGAQRELLKYYASISSNRWLMLKVFGILIVFVRGTLLVVGLYYIHEHLILVPGLYSGIMSSLLRSLHSYIHTYIYGTILLRISHLIQYPYCFPSSISDGRVTGTYV